MESALERGIEKLDQMIALHHVGFDIILLHVVEDVLRGDVTFAAPIDSLKRRVWLKRRSFTKGLPRELDLHLTFAGANEKLGEPFLRDHRDLLSLPKHFSYFIF